MIWCQGFSEPGAGTDLAALKTRAENRGDHYILNGSKIWTSYARKADWCFLLARTGAGRKEISAFLLPMKTPGISVISFPGLIKDGHLNEVFLSDVEVPMSGATRRGGRGLEDHYLRAVVRARGRSSLSRRPRGARSRDRAPEEGEPLRRSSDAIPRRPHCFEVRSRTTAHVSGGGSARAQASRIRRRRICVASRRSRPSRISWIS